MRYEELMEAYLESYEKITVYIHEQFYQGRSESFRLVDDSGYSATLHIEQIRRSGRAYSKYVLRAPQDIIIGKEYSIVVDYALRCILRYGYIVRTPRFDAEFSYSGGPLGTVYTPEYTDFSLWAPTASEVNVKIIGGEDTVFKIMQRGERGVWKCRAAGNLEGYGYNYMVKVNGAWNEAVDPYALSCNANKRIGYIIDPDRIGSENGKKDLPVLDSYTDAVIYETSVRDFTKQLDIPEAGKFNGMAKEGLKTPEGRTAGFDHIRELGVTHVQLMPVLDFSSIDEENPDLYYNWGYDPSHYMIPEGSYSSDPNDPYRRLKELHDLILQFHKAGIRVIFDVVYNHMREMVGSDLEKIVPYYYFRLSPTGEPSNGSFCGNDLDSTRFMTRRLILDSIRHCLVDFGADGFRFDLMGILDVTTMNQIEMMVHSIDPNAILLGEGWDMPTMLHGSDKAIIANQAKLPRIAQFNDFFREQVRGNGSENALSVKGYGSGDLNYIYAMPSCLMANSVKKDGFVQMFDSPEKSINYVECHDGATCWDKLKIACSGTSNCYRMQRTKFLMAFVLLSQGVPFIQSGQEFCRSKQGVINSYASKDAINQIDWSRKDRYISISNFTKDLITLRKSLPGLRLKTSAEIETKVRCEIDASNMLICWINCENDASEYHQIIVLFNGTESNNGILLDGTWKVLLDDSGLRENCTVRDQYEMGPVTVAVLGR